MTQHEDFNVRTTIAVIQLRGVSREGVSSRCWSGRDDRLSVRSVGAAYGRLWGDALEASGIGAAQECLVKTATRYRTKSLT